MNRTESKETEERPWVEYSVVTPQGEVKVWAQQQQGASGWCVGITFGEMDRIPVAKPTRQEADEIARVIAYSYEFTHGMPEPTAIIAQLDGKEPIQIQAEMRELLDALGGLDPDCERRLNAFYESPSDETWNDAYSINLRRSGRLSTLWQWIGELYTSFPTTGPTYDLCGERTSWSRIPTRAEFVAAMRAASAR